MSSKIHVTRAVQLSQFQKYLERYSGQKVKRPKDWFEAFDALRTYLDTIQKERIVVFLGHHQKRQKEPRRYGRIKMHVASNEYYKPYFANSSS